MKKLLSITMLLAFTIAVYAQQEKEVTQFLGIPVDGSKTEMIKKLQAKGFQKSEIGDLEGEFNGQNVYISVVTNNNKVYRIMVQDQIPKNESNIKIRFNNLCNQFANNPKYTSLDFTIPENEDIGYEMTVHKKRYEAVYYQLPLTSDFDNLILDFDKRCVWFMIGEVSYGYSIFLFYDNKYNQANGEDL